MKIQTHDWFQEFSKQKMGETSISHMLPLCNKGNSRGPDSARFSYGDSVSTLYFDIDFNHVKGEDNSFAEALPHCDCPESEEQLRTDGDRASACVEMGSAISGSVWQSILSGYTTDGFWQLFHKVITLSHYAKTLQKLMCSCLWIEDFLSLIYQFLTHTSDSATWGTRRRWPNCGSN